MKNKYGFFVRECLRKFHYLVGEFDCEIKSIEEKAHYDSVTFKNDTTAVEVTCQPRERDISVLIMRLVDGKIPEYPVFIREKTVLHSFYLDDLLRLRKPSLIPSRKPARVLLTDDNIDTMLNLYAQALRKHGFDILKGDFTVFLDVEKIVKKRAKEISGP